MFRRWAAQGSRSTGPHGCETEISCLRCPLAIDCLERTALLQIGRLCGVKVKRSQDGEDVQAMESYFHGSSNRTFLEMWALDGVKHSNTFSLETERKKTQPCDFFSLDLEGAELTALSSIDFRNVSFGVLVVEADGRNKTKDCNIQQMKKGRRGEGKRKRNTEKRGKLAR